MGCDDYRRGNYRFSWRKLGELVFAGFVGLFFGYLIACNICNEVINLF